MIRQRIKHAFLALTIALSSSLVLAPALASADFTSDACGGVSAIDSSACDKSNGNKLTSILKVVTNILSFIVGFVAVIMIIFSGFKYITAGGDSNGISSAKNSLIYAIVGLVIVAVAQVIVHVALTQASTASTICTQPHQKNCTVAK